MPNARSFIVYMARYYAKNGYKEGANNNNQFSDIVNRYGLKGCQNQPWCGTYQFALELMAFGKAAALKHWNMTANNYCGYSCFDTEKKFAAAKKTGTTPKVGALVIFKQSHMGRVISTDSKAKTFECAEGNSGDKCVVKTYSYTDSSIKSFCYIDYGDDCLTKDKILGALEAAYEMAHNLDWIYSDSGTIPPCVPDKRISCDRHPALACFILGFTNQPKGGFTVVNMEKYLTSWGWTKIKNKSELMGGDFILFSQDGTTAPMWKWHAFSLTYYNSANDIGKYDMGSNERIKAAQPYKKVAFDQWGDKSFYCGFRAPYSGELDGTYVIESAVNRAFAMDIRGASKAEKANLQLYKKNGTVAQTFVLEYKGNGYYGIKNINSGMYLDVSGAKVIDKRNIWQYKWNGTKAQLWKPQKNADGSFTFLSALDNNYAIDLSGAKAVNSQNIWLYKKNGTAAQKWYLVKK